MVTRLNDRFTRPLFALDGSGIIAKAGMASRCLGSQLEHIFTQYHFQETL